MGRSNQFLLPWNQNLRRPEDIKERWCEHYSELLNRHPVVDESVLDLIKQHDPIMALDEVPSRGEIKASVSQMNNNNKAPGIWHNSRDSKEWRWEKDWSPEQVIQSVWESEVPQDWRDVILVSLYKKGSKSDCSNFRGYLCCLLLENCFSRIISNRLVRTIVNEILPDHSAVFVQAMALWIWFSVLGNCRRSAKNRIFHCTNVSLTYQRLLILSTDQLFGRYNWNWAALRYLSVWFVLFTMEWRPELVSTALYQRKYLSTMGSNRVTFLHPCYSISTLPLSFS